MMNPLMFKGRVQLHVSVESAQNTQLFSQSRTSSPSNRLPTVFCVHCSH